MDKLKRKKGFKKILLVDDQVSIHKIFKRSIDSHWQITSAYNGQEALDLIEKTAEEFSVIILDGEMPYMNGAEFLCNFVQKYPDYAKKTHVMLHSGSEDFYYYLRNHELCSGLRLYDFTKGEKSRKLMKIFSANSF